MDNKNIYRILIPKMETKVDPEYFKKYYHRSNLSDRITCDICGRSATVHKLNRHQISKLCVKINILASE